MWTPMGEACGPSEGKEANHVDAHVRNMWTPLGEAFGPSEEKDANQMDAHVQSMWTPIVATEG
jgi:hypothetical protein